MQTKSRLPCSMERGRAFWPQLLHDAATLNETQSLTNKLCHHVEGPCAALQLRDWSRVRRSEQTHFKATAEICAAHTFSTALHGFLPILNDDCGLFLVSSICQSWSKHTHAPWRSRSRRSPLRRTRQHTAVVPSAVVRRQSRRLHPLTNAKQTTDAALKPLTPWVLGKLSANGAAAPSTFNISVDSIDNSALVLRPLSGGASLSLRLVNVDTSIPGVTTLILTSFEQWNLVWMLSTSSSQLPQAYVNIWNNFRASLGAACSNCPKYTFPRIDNVAPVSQGSSTCNYPPGVSPSYVDADIQK